MNPWRCTARLAAVSACLQLSIPATPAAAAPIADELARCAAIAAADARLACYDALAGHSAGVPTSAAPARGAAPAPTTPPTPAVKPVPAAQSDPQNFGLAQIQVHEAPPGPSSIQARVAQVIDDGVSRPSVVLDNGQTWMFAEPADAAALRPGDPVTVRRAALGSFMLVTPSKHAYHVHRTR